MGLFERYLSLWVALSIALGVALGHFFPGVFVDVAKFEFAGVNFVVAFLIWLMITPMMTQIDFTSLKSAARQPGGLALTLVVNWLIKPFTMAALAILFFQGFFAELVSPQSAQEYIAGLILLGVAPCTAMVFVWSTLTKGSASYTLIQVSVNDIIMVFAFAPLAGWLLGNSNVTVPWHTLFLSVVLYVVIPLAAGVVIRQFLVRRPHGLESFLERVKPASIVGLLTTVFLLFALQSETLVNKPEVVALISVPLLIQSYGIFALAYGLAWFFRLPHSVAAPAAMIGTSNFFELAVAVAIGLFGLHSGAALATVVGVLIEVPVMLSLVAFANRTRNSFERRQRPNSDLKNCSGPKQVAVETSGKN